MKELREEDFSNSYELAHFVNDLSIKQKDIQAIVYDTMAERFVLFYWCAL